MGLKLGGPPRKYRHWIISLCLRRNLQIRWSDTICSRDLWHLTKQKPAKIRQRHWRWICHTLGKPSTSTTRHVLRWNSQGKRSKGRPRNNWRHDFEPTWKWYQFSRIQHKYVHHVDVRNGRLSMQMSFGRTIFNSNSQKTHYLYPPIFPNTKAKQEKHTP